MDASAGDASQPFLSLAGISKRFGGTMALEGIDWSVDTGEVHCLVAENGSGKSTLIKIVSGVHIPDRGGSITIECSRYSSLTPKLAKSLGVQVISRTCRSSPISLCWRTYRSTASSGGLCFLRRGGPCAPPRSPRSHT
jgi:ABC-type sugar transport system ATPase subunit